MDHKKINFWNEGLRGYTAQVYGAARYIQGVQSYHNDFLYPLVSASRQFVDVESKRFMMRSPAQNLDNYYRLSLLNIDLTARYAQSAFDLCIGYNRQELQKFNYACKGDYFGFETARFLGRYFLQNEQTLRFVAEDLPKAIESIEPEFGFHFERHPGSLAAETERFYLWEVKPSGKGVAMDIHRKPILIIPPFVLGANILAFLPDEQKSYAHNFANRGIPTYIRVMKDIQKNPAVQTMNLEDDALDTRVFCDLIRARHGLPVTLNGYCQGGFSSLCNILSGELDGLVDALITCVAPMDGTRSRGLGKFLHALPEQFNDLAYGIKKLSGGNIVANGDIMGWVYKLKSIEESGPFIAYMKDLITVGIAGDPAGLNKTILALNYWLRNERSDLPMTVTEMSFLSYNRPVEKDGTLPISMFGKRLNFDRLKERQIPWLICYGENDDLVEKEVALAPLDYIQAEVTPFPKGHVAIATSWSHPQSKCPFDQRFGTNGERGPVRFHLDLEKEPKP